MTEELRELLEDVQTVYEGKGMEVHPNSFDKLRMEVIKLDNITKQIEPKWHDVWKDPQDVPDDCRLVLNQAGMPTAYQPDRGFLGIGGMGIHAWYEIPKFENKE